MYIGSLTFSFSHPNDRKASVCVYAWQCVCVCVSSQDESEKGGRVHLIYLPDCCVTMITPNGCHYNKWPDYCNSVWETYWRPNKPALNGMLLRLTLWHVHKRLLHRALTSLVSEAVIMISFFPAISKSEGLLLYLETASVEEDVYRSLRKILTQVFVTQISAFKVVFLSSKFIKRKKNT